MVGWVMTPAILQANKRLRFARRKLSRDREDGNFQALPQLAEEKGREPKMNKSEQETKFHELTAAAAAAAKSANLAANAVQAYQFFMTSADQHLSALKTQESTANNEFMEATSTLNGFINESIEMKMKEKPVEPKAAATKQAPKVDLELEYDDEDDPEGIDE